MPRNSDKILLYNYLLHGAHYTHQQTIIVDIFQRLDKLSP